MTALKIFKSVYFKKEPLSLVHFLTNRCNARCSFCFIDFDNPSTFKNELSLEEIDKVTSKLPKSLININFTGGEPFAHKNINEVADLYFKNTNINSIFITSNGSLPDRMIKFCEEITGKYPDKKFFFSLSIDSFEEEHNKIRKVKNIFRSCINAFHELKKISKQIQTNIAITVSHENHDKVIDLYDYLKKKYDVNAFSAILAREEGVYKIPEISKKKIQDAYYNLTQRIKSDLENQKNIYGYKNSLQAKVMNQKNQIVYEKIYSTSIKNEFISNCYAGSLFGVIQANGDVTPCEILDEKFGNLRDYDYDFMKLWNKKSSQDFCKKIKNNKCFCTYECAWTFNVLGNKKYHFDLLKGIAKT